jgi:hypothetical protein
MDLYALAIATLLSILVKERDVFLRVFEAVVTHEGLAI